MAKKNPEYGTLILEKTSREVSLNVSNRKVADVVAEFKRISIHGDHLAANDGELFEDKRRFRYTHVNRRRFNLAVNHFQGLQRLRSGKYLAISGADFTEPMSHIFVIKMGSRKARGAWGSNLLFSKRPKASDNLVKTIPLNRKFPHGGGMSAVGDILAVPLEGDNESKIVFLNMADPEDPTQLDCDIQRPKIAKAGAVAFAKLLNGKFVCGVWREVKKKPVGRLDFYISETTDLRDGFGKSQAGSKETRNVATWSYGDMKFSNSADDRGPGYQSINFIEPINKDAGNGVTRLYMIATENGSDLSPLQGGPDLVDLIEVLIPEDISNAPGKIPTLTKLDTKQFFCNREYCNLDAGGGIYVDPVSGFSLYSCYHWRSDDMIKLSEFRAEPDPKSEVANIDNAWINLYEDRDFGGRCLSVLGRRESTLPDYGKLFVQGGGFDNKVSSVKYQIPQGFTYRLYQNKSFAGEQQGQDVIDLNGTGKIQKISNLKAKFPNLENKISSSQYV